LLFRGDAVVARLAELDIDAAVIKLDTIGAKRSKNANGIC